MNDAYQRYAPALVRKVERMLGSRDDALDVVHAMFLDLYQEGRSVLDLPYLYRMATHRALNHLRDAKNRQRLLALHESSATPAGRVRLEDHVVTRDVLLKVARALDDVTAEVLVYHFFDDLTQDEIAKLTRTSRKTVGKRLAKASQVAATIISPPTEDATP